jgi:hypothetical protein
MQRIKISPRGLEVEGPAKLIAFVFVSSLVLTTLRKEHIAIILSALLAFFLIFVKIVERQVKIFGKLK